MFPKGYYAQRHYAPRYFPPVPLVEEDNYTYEGFFDLGLRKQIKEEDDELIAVIAAFMEIQ